MKNAKKKNTNICCQDPRSTSKSINFTKWPLKKCSTKSKLNKTFHQNQRKCMITFSKESVACFVRRNIWNRFSWKPSLVSLTLFAKGRLESIGWDYLLSQDVQSCLCTLQQLWEVFRVGKKCTFQVSSDVFSHFCSSRLIERRKVGGMKKPDRWSAVC